MVLVTVQQSVAAHSCPPFPPSLAQPLLFSMCNLKLICTTGYLTGATDTESVLFLLKHSMELTLNLNKTNLN
uniref:Uncharacterized protein n=1 Tax=Oryctolagus cuniculus TaxID=9986 RepID=A0A5F9DJ17_RABIT